MTSYSQNGYTANDRSVIGSFTVPGTTTRLALRKGDTSVLLLDYAAWFDQHIESIDGGTVDDWGYAERTIRGSSTTLSNHASGTAMDLNAVLHPLGRVNTFGTVERAMVRARLELYRGCLRWGGDYSGRHDDMHVEINAGAAACRAVADDIRAGRLGGTSDQLTDQETEALMARLDIVKLGSKDSEISGEPVKSRQALLISRGLLPAGADDGDFGPQTDEALRTFQATAGLKADGVCGAETLYALLA